MTTINVEILNLTSKELIVLESFLKSNEMVDRVTFIKPEDDMYHYNMNYNDIIIPEFIINCLNNNIKLPRFIFNEENIYNYLKEYIIKYKLNVNLLTKFQDEKITNIH